MKKLVLYELENQIFLSPQHIAALIVETPKKLYEYVSMLIAQSKGGIGDFVFSENGQELSIEKNFIFIYDFFDLSLNSKSITNLLTKKIASLNDTILFNEGFNNVISLLIKLISDAEYELNLKLDYNEEVDISALFKACGVKIHEDESTLVEKLAVLVDVMLELKPFSVLVLLHAHTYLSATELALLKKHCELKQISLLLIEGSAPRERLNDEKLLIIDDDLCEILVE